MLIIIKKTMVRGMERSTPNTDISQIPSPGLTGSSGGGIPLQGF